MQVELHPSLLLVLLSSHSSVGCLRPSPQIVAQAVFRAFGDCPPYQRSQVSGVVVDPPLHIPKVSKVHVEEHPSPSTKLLLSHCSVACLSPSPQLTVHNDLATFWDVPPVHSVQVSGFLRSPPVQTYPSSMRHVEEHPSLLIKFPSSQISSGCLLLSPQLTTHLSFGVFGERPFSHSSHSSGESSVP